MIVTAERRATDVQDTPISIVALSGETLRERGVATLDNLQYQVPSVTFVDVGNVKYLNIRGVGLSEGAPNQTTGVAVHIDGGYVAREFILGDAFFDLASVEVLRGPQGTYVGQNGSGGAIFINSAGPRIGSTSGFADAEFGSFNHRRLGAGVNIPLGEMFAARVSGEWEKRDSFYKNYGTQLSNSVDQVDHQPGDVNRRLARVQLLFAPNDDFEARLIHQTSVNNSGGPAFKEFPVPGTRTLPSRNLWDITYDFPSRVDVSYDRTTGIADWTHASGVRLHTLLVHNTTKQRMVADDDYTSPYEMDIPQSGRDFLVTDRYTTGEIDLISPEGQALSWTVGATFLKFKQRNKLNFFDYNTPAHTDFSFDPNRDASLFLNLTSIRDNVGVFGEVGYKLNDQFEVRVGGRYNYDKVGFGSDSYLGFSYNSPPVIPLAPPLETFENWTGRALLNWTPTDDTLVYLTVSRGYKPGGTTPFGDNYDSEFVLNTELGWKATLLDGALQTSVAAFNMAYDDFQRTYSIDANDPNPASATTKNVSGTKIRGVEAQVTAITGPLVWDGSVSLTKGEYGDLALVLPPGAIDGALPAAATNINLKGRSIDYLPKRSANLGVTYSRDVGSGEFTAGARVSYQSSYYTSFFQMPYDLVPAKTLLDLTAGYESADGWAVQGYVRNATDKLYISTAQGGATAPGTYLLGAPRQFGVRLSYRFE